MTPQQSSQLREIATAWPEEKPEIKPSDSRWFHSQHRSVFNKLCSLHPQGLFLELGTWTGMGSTKFVLDRFPGMFVACIDHFRGSVEHHKDDIHNQVASQLWCHFCANLWKYRDRVYPFRVSTLAGMQLIAFAGVKPDFIYIDASHDEESVYLDIRGALNLFPDAIIIGDDYNAAGYHPGVRRAIQQAIKAGLFAQDEFCHEGRVWYLTRNVK